MKKFQNVLQYEHYLTPTSEIGAWKGGDVINGCIQVPYFQYTSKIVEFMEFFQTSEYANPNYMETIEKHGWLDRAKLRDDIPRMNEKEVLTCLTALIRQERFCDGFFAGCIEEGVVEALLRRLEEFREIIFDFRGIGFMGQGFADEVFRVFQNMHPDIKLTVVNANAAVEGMIRHVKRDRTAE